jgi:MbtH protein
MPGAEYHPAARDFGCRTRLIGGYCTEPINVEPRRLGVTGADNSRAELFDVVANDEEQYSIWPAGRDIPAGWRVSGPRDSKERCLVYIKEVSTDMRPLSLRRASAPAEPGLLQ